MSKQKYKWCSKNNKAPENVGCSFKDTHHDCVSDGTYWNHRTEQREVVGECPFLEYTDNPVRYSIEKRVTSFRGTEIWITDALNKEEALKKFNNGECELESHVYEVLNYKNSDISEVSEYEK